jgi:hypothetical protein
MQEVCQLYDVHKLSIVSEIRKCIPNPGVLYPKSSTLYQILVKIYAHKQFLWEV